MAVSLLALLAVPAWKPVRRSKEPVQALLAAGLLLAAMAVESLGSRLIVCVEETERRLQSAKAWQRYWAERVNEEKAKQGHR
jgi:hypothetical protein